MHPRSLRYAGALLASARCGRRLSHLRSRLERKSLAAAAKLPEQSIMKGGDPHALNSMQLRQSSNCLVGRVAGEPVAQIAWDAVEDGWYINFLFVAEPQHLAPLLSRFRQIWRDNGEPRLSADVAADNLRMRKLAQIISSVPRNNPQVEINHGYQ